MRQMPPPPVAMAELSVRAPAKINLHLEVLGLRPDGFHELAMVMQTLNLEDRLHLHLRSDATTDPVAVIDRTCPATATI